MRSSPKHLPTLPLTRLVVRVSVTHLAFQLSCIFLCTCLSHGVFFFTARAYLIANQPRWPSWTPPSEWPQRSSHHSSPHPMSHLLARLSLPLPMVRNGCGSHASSLMCVRLRGDNCRTHLFSASCVLLSRNSVVAAVELARVAASSSSPAPFALAPTHPSNQVAVTLGLHKNLHGQNLLPATLPILGTHSTIVDTPGKVGTAPQ